jgi:hypothetical protein
VGVVRRRGGVASLSPRPIAGRTRTRQGQHRLGVGLPQPHCAAPPSSRPPPHRDTRDKAGPAHARPANPSRVRRSDPSASQHARVCPSCCPRPHTQRESESIRAHRVTPPPPPSLSTHTQREQSGPSWGDVPQRRPTAAYLPAHPQSQVRVLSLVLSRVLPPSPPSSLSAPSSFSLLSLRLLLFPLPSPCSPCRAGRQPALPPAARRRLSPAPSLAGLAAAASLAPHAKAACAFLSTLH